MRPRITSLLAVWAGLAALACSGDRGGTSPAGPRLSAATAPSNACSFNSMNSLVAHYFSSTEAQVVRGLLNQMQAATDTTPRRDRGFDVMAHIAGNVSTGNPGAQDAAALTNGLLACMFFSAAELPATFPEDFSVATDPALDGAYAIRGGATDPAVDVVYSRAAGFAQGFSGVAPPSSSTWSAIVSSVRAPGRILVYGRPGSNSSSYDWKVVPANATFNPSLVVGLCVDASRNATAMLNEENIGFLSFVDAGFLAGGICSPVAFGGPGSGPAFLARRLVRGVESLFAVPSAWARSVFNPGGIGGSTGGIHSVFTAAPVQATLTFIVQPSDSRVNQIIAPPVQVRAVDATTGKTVAGVQITLMQINNNGVTGTLNGTTTRPTDNSGIATFADLSLSKAGGYVLVASGSVVGRDAIVVPTIPSDHFNNRP